MLRFLDGREVLRKSEPGSTLEVLVAGDCCPWHSAVAPILEGKSSDILSAIQPVLDDCDLSVIQFETPLTHAETAISKSGPNLKCPPECVDFVKAGGFDVAALANNHIGDFGPAPVLETIGILQRNGIKTVGAGKDLEAARRPLFIARNGMKVAFINVAENEFGTAGLGKPGAAPLDPLNTIKAIQQAAKQAHHVIVIMHGGNETYPLPSPRVMKTCRAFADAGAHAVIHIHAHCPQGIEVWGGVPIFYCPGNFYFPTPWQKFDPTSFWWHGFIIKLAFDRQAAFRFEIVPYTFGLTPEKIVPMTGRQKDAFCKYMAKLSRIIQSPAQVQRYFDGWCALRGHDVLSNLRRASALWPIEHRDPAALKSFMSLRNTFTCEAHNELATRFLRMVEEDRVEEAKRYIPTIRRLQRAIF